jgi:hypothetical protein
MNSVPVRKLDSLGFGGVVVDIDIVTIQHQRDASSAYGVDDKHAADSSGAAARSARPIQV